MSSLPTVAAADHWRAAWVGLDCAEAVVLLLTGWLLYAGSRAAAVTAGMACALLWMDAWFDVLTSRGEDLHVALLLAIVVEVPLGILCLFVAVRQVRREGWTGRPADKDPDETS